jgi:hypothetical protein
MQVHGWTALHMAALYSHNYVVKALLAAGANVSATLAVQPVRGLVSRVCCVPRLKRCIGLVVWQ